MLTVRLIVLLVLLSGCQQLYNRDTLIITGPEFCGVRWQVLETLLRVREETLIEDSQIELDRVRLELTSSEGGNTISVLMSWPEGFSCVIVSGQRIIRKTKDMRASQ